MNLAMLSVYIVHKNIIPEHNLGIGCLCEGNWCEEAQDGYAEENNIELED